MTSFDYLHSHHAHALARLLDLRIPHRLQPAFIGLFAAAAFVGSAWGIEAYRLSAAKEVESEYSVRYERSRAALAAANLYYGRVKDIVEVDERLREVAASGDEDALRLAAVANALPAQAWLTSIGHDDSGVLLDGGAKDLRVVADFENALAHAPGVRDPLLVAAGSDDAAERGTSGVNFTLRLQAETP